MIPSARAARRSACVGLGLALGALSASATVLTFTWRNAPLDSDPVGVNGASNWTSSVSRSPQSADNADLVFQASGTTNLSFSTSLDVNSVTFSSTYPAYTFSSSGSRSLGLGSGGLTTASTGTGAVTFASSLGIVLNASQTWSIGGNVIVNSVISPASTSYLLTKTGSGTLTLNGANSFDGGFTLSAGTLVVGSSTSGSTGPVGSGTLTLANGTTLAASSGTLTLGNHVHVSGTSLTFGAASATGGLIFSGSFEFQNSGATTLHSAGASVQFTHELEASDGAAQIVFTGDSPFILAGEVKTNINGVTAGTTTTAGSVLFTTANSVANTNLTINAALAGSYVGVRDSSQSAYFSTTSGLAIFLDRLSSRGTFAGTLGFDSPSGQTISYVGGTSSALNLSGFTGANFQGLGTTSSAVIGSSVVITPPTSGLKFSALKSGIFKIDAPLSSGNSVNQVFINENAADATTGAVILTSGTSNYTGGTTLKAGYLLFGASSSVGLTQGPLGTSTLTLPSGTTGFLAGTSSGLVLRNPIALGSSTTNLKVGLSSSTASAIQTAGNNTFELAGIISGGGKLFVHNQDGAVTLSGANTFTGAADIAAASLILKAGSALGPTSSSVYLSGNSSLVVDTGTLSIGSLDSASGTSSTISLGSNQLAIYQNNAGTYRGTITGTGSVAKHNAGTITFANATTYTGGTTIHSGKVILASGATLGGSTSAITLNNGATLIANSGATVSNPLTLNSGSSIGGAGTFATTIYVGSGVTLSPGTSPGTMTFSSGLTFNPGGTLAFEVNNATGTAGAASGWDLLSITGTLALNATAVSPFTLQIKSLDNANASGNALNFNASNTYAWTFANATTITGFDASEFSLDRSAFSNTSAGQFFVSQSGNSLVLNFTPVPEPSTYVLMGTGLSLLAASALRRRRRSDKSS